MPSAVQVVTTIFDVGTLAFFTAIAVQLTKFWTYAIKDAALQNRTVQLYVFVVAQLVVLGWDFMHYGAATRPQILADLTLGFSVFGAAVANYHLLTSDTLPGRVLGAILPPTPGPAATLPAGDPVPAAEPAAGTMQLGPLADTAAT